MLRKNLSILLLYSALAIMLGHSFIPHRHDFEQGHIHHHNHDHDDIPHNHDSDDESTDWGQLFANFHHGSSGQIFITSHTSVDSISNKHTQSAKLIISFVFIRQINQDVRQNAPPNISEFYNTHQYLPNGLRAPPSIIV